MVRAVLALAGVGVVALPATTANADPHPSCALSWVELPGAESCGGAPVMARAIEKRLGRAAIVSPAQADLSIEARAERSGRPPLWHAVLVLRDADGKVLGTRELNSAADDCEELRSAVVVTAALMIDPDAPLHGRQPPSLDPPAPLPAVAPQAPETRPAPAPQVIVERVEVPVPMPVPAPPQAWRVEPSASFSVGFGVLPSVAVGVRGGVIVTPPQMWALEAFGVAWGNQTAPAEQGAQVRFSVTEAGLAVCPIHLGREPRPTLSVCGGAEAVFFESESLGFEASKSSLSPSVRAVIPGGLSFPLLKGVAVRVGGELGLALSRNQFVYYQDGSQTAHVVSGSPLVMAECDTGLSVSLP
jgi:hypothetical protein